ncbi:hypothetical protein EI94DRAFT_1707144 [Lactarius quietus]|nr:hypothetical protein EI94DRAFT_1707144 [Lactarius quietus]
MLEARYWRWFRPKKCGTVNVLDGWARIHVTHGWIGAIPPSGPGALPSARRLYLPLFLRLFSIRRQSQLVEGQGSHASRTGYAPRPQAQYHKDAHQPKIGQFESFKGVAGEVDGEVGGTIGNIAQCQVGGARAKSRGPSQHDLLANLPRMGLHVVRRTGGDVLIEFDDFELGYRYLRAVEGDRRTAPAYPSFC